MRSVLASIFIRLKSLWVSFWMGHAGYSPSGRMATRLASLFSPPYKSRSHLARLNARGYISPIATIHHAGLHLEEHIFIGDGVVIYQAEGGGSVKIGKGAHVHRDSIIETGKNGSLSIGEDTHIQPRCQFSAYKGKIEIGCGVQIAPNCAFYPYNHGFAPDESIKEQPLQTKGGIFIDDDAWLGVGVIVLDGVKIGKGAVIGAGSVVTRDIPSGAIAAGNPARLIGKR